MMAGGERGQAGALIAVGLGVIVLFAFVGTAVLIATLRSSSGESENDIYVSIGDSIAAGNGASEPRITGFAPLLAAREEMTLHNLAEAGATSDDVLSDQLGRALVMIQSGRTGLVTISVGGNDLAALIPNAACVEEPLPPSCPLDESLAKVKYNVGTMLSFIRDAHTRVPIVLLAYPNLFSGTGHAWEAPAARVLPRLGDVMRDLAARYDHVAVADPSPAFEGNGDELTGVLADPFDPHPNDAGHRAIADAFAEALGDLE
jgi:lysophospholipase L1-like esterase